MLALSGAEKDSAKSEAADVDFREDDSESALTLSLGPFKLVESSEIDQDRRHRPEANHHRLWNPSLITGLPTELLRHIFLETGMFVAVDQGDVFNIMAVCQRWHSVARSILPLLPSPIYRLSNKLLVRIFLLSHATLEYAYYSDFAAIAHKPLSVFDRGTVFDLMAVCHRWRNLVLSTPELWAMFSIRLEEKGAFDEERARSLEKVVDLHLERSGCQPLTLDVAAGAWSGGNDTAEHPLWPKLVASSPRWKIFEVSFGEPTLDIVHSLVGIQLPNLERLEISHDFNGPVDLGFIRSAPKLRSIGGGHFVLSESTVDLLRQVTVLSTFTSLSALVGMVQSSFTQVLEHCPNLQSLAFERCYDNDESSSSRYRFHPLSVPITHLQVLVWHRHKDLSSTTLSSSMAFITAPKLTSLVLKQEEEEYLEHPVSVVSSNPELVRSAFSVVHDFLMRSNCVLTVLVLRGLNLSDRQAVQLLRLTPTLVELTVGDASGPDIDLNHCPVSKYFIRSLHSYTSSPLHPSAVVGPLVPRLRLLHLRVRSVPFDYDAFIGTVSSRWLLDTPDVAQTGVERLRSVVLELAEEVDDVKVEPLSRLDRAGLRVVVKRLSGDLR